MFDSGGDSGFSLDSMYTGGVNFSQPAIDPAAPQVALQDDNENKKYNPNNPLAYYQNNSPFSYTYNPAQTLTQGQGESGDGPVTYDQGAQMLSSNGRALDLGADNTFRDVFDKPGGAGEREKVGVTYQYDPTSGSSTPTQAHEFFQGSDWAGTWMPVLQALAPVLTAGIGGAYGAGSFGGGATAAEGATWNPALIDSYLGTSGYGASSASGLAGGATAGGFDGGDGGEGLDTGGEDFVRSSSDRAAQYNNMGYGAGKDSFLQTVGNGALRGAGVNGAMTAAQGGDMNDILKNAAIGGVTGGIGGGIGYANPAEYAGISDPSYQRYANNALSASVNAGATGGNIGQALGRSAIGSGVNYAGNGVANYVNSGGGDMPLGDMPDIGTLGGTMQGEGSQLGENSATLGGMGSNLQAGADAAASYNTPQMGSNPFIPMVQQALGLVAPNGSGGVSGNGLGNMTGSLMGLYSAYQKRKQLGQLQGGLQGLYGQDSPYAQNLRSQLARRDAAGGRRSQYGPREVELQAKLAGLNAQMAPTLANIMGQHNGATNMGLYNIAQLFNGTGAGQKIGGMAGDWGQSLYNQLFGSPMAGANVGPQMEG